MTVKDFIHSVCQGREMGISRLAAEMDVNENTLRTTISRNDGMGMTVGKLADWVEKMDMQLVIMGLNEDEEYIIDGEFEDIPLK